MAKQNQNIGESGSPTWGVNRFRQYLLGALIKDLETLETKGLDDTSCEHVQKCLEEIVENCSKLPDKAMLQTIVVDELNSFRKVYARWNGPNGSDAKAIKERKDALTKLRNHRKRLSHRLGRRQKALATSVDDEFVLTLWEKIESIPSTLPNEFPRLHRAVIRTKASLNVKA